MRAHASRTALLIAGAMRLQRCEPAWAHLVDDATAHIARACLRASGGPGRRLLNAIDSSIGRALLRLAQRVTVPGLARHFVLRKRAIEAYVRAAIDAGARRVIVVAAGFDTLAARLSSEYRHVAFIEIDHPATLAVKRAALAQAAPLHAVRLIQADLASESLRAALSRDADASLTAPTVVIIEGLTMYLPATAVFRLLRDALALAGDGGTLIVTFMEPCVDGRLAFHDATWLAAYVLARFREPFVWGASRDSLREWFAQQGVADVRFFDARMLATLAPDRDPAARGEVIAVATTPKRARPMA